ncbi:MAG TPA: ankyrin repeat domain-containing protein [Pyrinomonadaceae bacterium]
MSDALPLPPRPKLAQYETLAELLRVACQSGEVDDIRDWATDWIQTVAKRSGFDLHKQQQARMGWQVDGVVRDWQKHLTDRPRPGSSSSARAFVAHIHEFETWTAFVKFLDGLAQPKSEITKFERAADAIVSGDLVTLNQLLQKHPELIRARSARKHRSTLLHYVSANGIEDFRQKTPKNIIAITRRLLEAGADVNAESEAYGGRSTTFGLTATSCHPQDAGVQLPLLSLLIDHGAIIDGPDGGSAVKGALYNGSGEAAKYLAQRGAKLDLEGAAGVGRLDVVKTFFTEDGKLKRTATKQEMLNAFAWACQFGHVDVVEFLLERGVSINAALKHHGQTGLHWAAYGGHVAIVKLLLDRGASVHTKDPTFEGTPLQWALYEWRQLKGKKRQPYYAVVSTLVKAGANLDLELYEANEEGSRVLEMFRSDSKMAVALRLKD